MEDQQNGAPPSKGEAKDESFNPFELMRTESSIPPLTHIPETKEERQQKRIIRISAAAVALILLTIFTVMFVRWRHRVNVDDAARRACDTGLPEDFARTLELLKSDDEPGLVAMRARLLATARYEHAQDTLVDAQDALKQLGPEESARVDARIAQVYLALSQQEIRKAQEVASSLAIAGDFAEEVARVRAQTALAMGNPTQALQEAEQAARMRPHASRHLALLAWVYGRLGDTQKALGALREAQSGNAGAPGVFVRQARIDLRARNFADAKAHIEKVLASQSDKAKWSEADRRWAELIRARLAVEEGDAASALKRLRESVKEAPFGDEEFILENTNVRLLSGAYRDAASAWAEWHSPVSTDIVRRARQAAELDRRIGGTARITRWLELVPQGGEKQFLLGQHAAALGQIEKARSCFVNASREANTKDDALEALAALELEQGRAHQALERVAPLLEKTDVTPALVQAVTKAMISIGETARALELCDRSLKKHPNHALLLGARGSVLLAMQDPANAKTLLVKAADLRPTDAGILADLGEAEVRLGQLGDAKKAYQRALDQEKTHPLALTGLFELAVDAPDLESAQNLLTKIEANQISSMRIHRARGRYFLALGMGQDAVNSVRRVVLKERSDGALWNILGALYVQAEQYGAAAGSFAKALDVDENDPEGLYGLALTQIRLRRLQPAQKNIDAAEEAGKAKHLGARFSARILVLRGLLRLAYKSALGAQKFAEKALEVDAQSADALLLLADIAQDRKREPLEYLQKAVALVTPPPQAYGRFAIASPTHTRACDFARRYRKAAPRGRYAQDLGKFVAKECRG